MRCDIAKGGLCLLIELKQEGGSFSHVYSAADRFTTWTLTPRGMKALTPAELSFRRGSTLYSTNL